MLTKKLIASFIIASFSGIMICERTQSSDYSLGQHDKVLSDYTQILAIDPIDPEDARAYIKRAFSHEKLEQYDLAIADYTQAISLSPKAAVSYKNRGNIYREIGKIEEARKDWEKAASLYQQQGNIKEYQAIQKQLQEL